jgi:aspartyl/asparaginyl-tRNA synthetase
LTCEGTLPKEVVLEALKCCRDVYPHDQDFLVSRKVAGHTILAVEGTIFPMFEFEMHGGVEELEKMEIELCEHLGIPLDQENIQTYDDWTNQYNTKELEHEHEEKIGRGMITKFPEWTSPFWNMARNDDGTSKKIDVILNGMETIGSAERSTDKEQMRETFHTISDGQYADLLFKLFGKERVEKELDEFLEFDFFPRSGGGIGVTRIMQALPD